MATNSASKPSSSNANTEIESKILEIAQNKPSGISNKDILDGIPGLQSTELAQAINKLIKQG